MTAATTYGWDLGGAHLKRVTMDDRGRLVEARQLACPLWRGIEHLTAAIAAIHERNNGADVDHAITMTGELCDGFASRAEGVVAIASAAAAILGNDQTRFYAGGAGWVSPDAVGGDNIPRIASANWLAMAEAVALQCSDAMLIDVGSTTSDLIPIVAGEVVCRGRDDPSRLEFDELVYTGVVRTPLMALAGHVPFAGRTQRVAAEYFANTADVYRIRGELPDNADLHETADGADRSADASSRRIMRMLGRESESDHLRVRQVADYYAYRQFDLLQRAFLRVASTMQNPCRRIIAAGAGDFIVRRLAAFNGVDCIEFASLFELAGAEPAMVSSCAPAAALTVLKRASQ